MKFIILFLSLVYAPAKAQIADDVNSTVGLHLITTDPFNQRYEFISANPTLAEIEELLDNLDWVGKFHQVVLTKSNNISMEVGGSMDPEDGLSAVYRELDNKVYSVTGAPPSNVGQMKQILSLFMNNDNSWKTLYEFKTYPY
jgi:hypothetical protein